MTHIPMNAKVDCANGHCGESVEVIVNPVKRTITHFVVEDSSLPDYPTRLVPIEMVVSTTHELITIDCNRDEFIRLEPFITNRYVEPQSSMVAPVYWGADSYVDPLVISDTPANLIEIAHIPRGELAVYKGMHVHATDGHSGTVDELVVDDEGEVITHILMLKGHLWGKKDVAIPISAIEEIDGDIVHLNIDKQAIKDLPTVSVKRHSD